MHEKGFTPDVITGHWINPQIFLLKALGEKFNVPTTLVFHGDYSEKRLKKLNAINEIRAISNIGCRSQTASGVIKERLKLKDYPFVCASGIPDSYISACDLHEDKEFADNSLQIISAGRLVKYKCFDAIIDAISTGFVNTTVSCDIYGKGDLEGELSDHIRSLGLEDRIILRGFVDRECLQEKMEEAHVFCLISKNETFGLVYLEAMIHGCIVIASRYGGVDGIIQNGENGFLCDEGNASELHDIFSKICNMSIEEKKNISRKAKETAIMYSDSIVADKYLKQICSNIATVI